jgi:hypothetical protein
MSKHTHFEIPLFDLGVEGAGFRVDNERTGELQRHHIDQYRVSDVKYQADLFAVVHGTMSPGGKRGVLVVIDFHFVSDPQGRRFRSVEISLAFGREDLPIGGPKEPEVVQIVPRGTFGMDEATQSRVDTFEVNGSAEAGMSLATLGIGGSYQRVITADVKSYATLDGMPWLEVRNSGEWNSAQWSIKENKQLKHGVPADLRCAILLSLPDDAKFRAELSVTASIGTFHSKMKREVGAKTGLQPVYFDPSSEKGRIDLGPALTDVDKSKLAECKLASIGSAKASAPKPGGVKEKCVTCPAGS